MNYLYITQILSSPSWTPLPTQREHPPSQVSCWWVVEALATMLMEKILHHQLVQDFLHQQY